MRKHLLSAFTTFVIATTSHAVTIEFTSPDYSDGGLDGQQNWNAQANWTVADSAGAGNVSTTASNHIATLDEAVTLPNPNDTFHMSVDFDMLGASDPNTPTTFVYAFMSGLKDNNSNSSHGIGAAPADANIQIINGTDNYRLLNNFGTISGANTITGTKLSGGDNLRFDYRLKLGNDATTTTYNVRLRNLTDGTDTTTGTVTGVDAGVYNALTGVGAYSFFQTLNSAAGASGLTGVQVNSVTQSSVATTPGPGKHIDFTSPDYTDGGLDGQQDWNAEASWSVSNSGSTGDVSTPTVNDIATLDDPITLSSGESYGFSINLEMLGAYVSDPNHNFVYTFMAGLKEDNTSAGHGIGDADAADANIQIVRSTDTYRLLNNFNTISGASGISGTVLDEGDILQFDYELTLGSDPNGADSFFEVRLQNLTDGTDTGFGTVTGITSTLYNALTGSGAYAFFHSLNFSAGASGYTGVQVNSITIIPEPTSAFLACFGLVVVMRRKHWQV